MHRSICNRRQGVVSFGVAVAALMLAVTPAAAERAIAVVNGTALVEFDTNTPAGATAPRAITGLASGETLVGLDLRPATGLLYGLGSTGQLYLVDGTSGRVTAIGAPIALSGTQFGFDFNPTVDRIRVVSDAGQNLRLHPDTGAVAANDVALTAGFTVGGAAYTNNFAGAATTTLYDVDAAGDQLVIQNPPNNGTLVPVGALGVDISAAAGFDISATTGVAYVADVVGGQSRLYTVNLTSGAATAAGTLGDGTLAVTGLTLTSRAVRMWGLTDTNALMSFSSGAPGTTTTPVTITGLQGGESLLGIDIRPATGGLYGLGSTGRIYLVDRVTGLATAVGAPIALSGTAFGFDFNPTVDRIRLVSNTGQNLRLNPDTGALAAADTALTPFTGVSAAAYTNNRAGATTTTLYDIETTTDQLLVQNPPNAGNLTAVGPLGVDASDVNGFDISSADGTAYAALTVAGTPQLYTIDLTTGAARLVGVIAGVTGLRGLAAEIPLPYAFAEGATGAFFTTEFALANPTAINAPVTAVFQRADGASIARTLTVGAFSRVTLDAATVPGLAAAAFGSVFTSSDGVPLAVERTMRWDATGYGMHGERAVGGPALVWHFAEGSQGFFENYLLLSNPGATANTATVEFLVQGGAPVTRVVTLAPMSRVNVYGGEVPELANRAFGATVTFSAPGVAERAMYFGQPLFNGGSVASGVQAPSTVWYHAEGATGAYFDTFLLLANPGATDATATVTYLLPAGGPVVRNYLVPAKQRVTINVEQEDALLADTAVGMAVSATQPLLSERAMYWPGTSAQWFESHASFGVTTLGQRWAFGEGRVGGPNNYATFLLVANPGMTDSTSTVTFLRANGTTVQRTITVPKQSRANIWVNVDIPELADESFGVSIVSSAPVFAERAMYSDSGGVQFAAGSVVTAARVP
ncbi:MAG TPA: DUF4394 domain-containing protein [Luteitalea sp.]|nr:DUF4394 domain-containing protein [Luteitalea sp.]